jgi:hypothetical protein
MIEEIIIRQKKKLCTNMKIRSIVQSFIFTVYWMIPPETPSKWKESHGTVTKLL